MRVEVDNLILDIDSRSIIDRLVGLGLVENADQAVKHLARFLRYLILDLKEHSIYRRYINRLVYEDCLYYIGMWIRDIDKLLDRNYRREIYSLCREIAEKHVKIMEKS